MLMEIKTNYFLRNMVDVGKTLPQYLNDARYNYVILEKDIPLVWASDNSPVIFGDKDSVEEELVNNPYHRKDVKVITELEFIEENCLLDIYHYLNSLIFQKGTNDGVTFIVYLDENFEGLVKTNGVIYDILGVYANIHSKEPSVYLSSEDDSKHFFKYFGDLSMDIMIKIIEYVEQYKNNE